MREKASLWIHADIKRIIKKYYEHNIEHKKRDMEDIKRTEIRLVEMKTIISEMK